MVWDYKEVLNALHTLALEKGEDIVETIRKLINPTTDDYEEEPKAMVGVGLRYAMYMEECCNSIKVSKVTPALDSADINILKGYSPHANRDLTLRYSRERWFSRRLGRP